MIEERTEQSLNIRMKFQHINDEAEIKTMSVIRTFSEREKIKSKLNENDDRFCLNIEF